MARVPATHRALGPLLGLGENVYLLTTLCTEHAERAERAGAIVKDYDGPQVCTSPH